jgi:hypothetical protein
MRRGFKPLADLRVSEGILAVQKSYSLRDSYARPYFINNFL